MYINNISRMDPSWVIPKTLTFFLNQTSMEPEKWTLGKGDSYWKPSFPGSMLIFWGVTWNSFQSFWGHFPCFSPPPFEVTNPVLVSLGGDENNLPKQMPVSLLTATPTKNLAKLHFGAKGC